MAFVERNLLPVGFEVRANERVYNDDGAQIAELDLVISGKVGTTDFTWLIECRDRPSDGPAPGSWIEQLVGRRDRFGFNKVTAVSTTSFSPGALQYGREAKIELRAVRSLAPEELSWLAIRHITQRQYQVHLEQTQLHFDRETDENLSDALAEALRTRQPEENLLKSSKNGAYIPASTAFAHAVRASDLLEALAPGEEKPVRLRVVYTNDDAHFVVETHLGDIRVQAFTFIGRLKLIEQFVPLETTSSYFDVDACAAISWVASFAPQDIMGAKFSLEFHKLAATGETHMLMRRATDDDGV
ncbi:hypothetical protein WMF45_12055 [Sorangium sp. So ce448]|uniref:hypothetical protein n=1 Tax=Sorangium sp. So ce448 TaxID=3133314 RepID=UPI003F624965